MIVMETSSLVCSRHHFTTSVPEMHCYLFCFFFLKKKVADAVIQLETLTPQSLLLVCLKVYFYLFIYLLQS